MPPATPNKGVASLCVRRVKRGRFGGLLRNAACCDGGLWIFGGVWLKRPTKRKRICRGGYQSTANPPVMLRMTAPFSVTPQKYEPTAMDFWMVERMHASEASRSKGAFKSQ